jgi:hypothetical protein
MEIRQLTTDNERRVFGECLARARATRGTAFREKARSRFGMAHLTFGNAYAIFENHRDAAAQMVAGFIVHDLVTLPQSFPKPDLSSLPPASVIEGCDLWSLSSGFGRIAAAGAAAVAGIIQAKAIIVYPLVDPVDLTAPYTQFKFDKAGEPLKAPYSETFDEGDMWVQPMILQGEKLAEYVRWGFDFLLNSGNDRLTLRFDKPAAASPRTDQMRESNSGDEARSEGANQPAAFTEERNAGAVG